LNQFPEINTLPAVIWSGLNCDWHIFSRDRIVQPNSLRNRLFLIAVSLRNPRFSNIWLRSTFKDISALDGQIHLCLVDGPYVERAKERSAEADLGRQLAILHRQREEQERRLKRLASSFGDRVLLFGWNQLERLVPRALFRELEAAYYSRGSVYKTLLDQIKRSLPDTVPAEEVENSSAFLLNEFPVLTYIYYKPREFPLIDVYPGPQAPFFWLLEKGCFSDELPQATELAKASPGLIYADVYAKPESRKGKGHSPH
jgi:hypothetical protein